MRCEDFEERISAYLDGELDDDGTRIFEQHLLLCPDCRDLLRGIGEVRGALRGLGAAVPPPEFDLRLPTSLRHEIWQQRCAWAQPLTMGLAVVAALAILLWPLADPEDETGIFPQERDLQSMARAWVPVPEPRLFDLWERHGRARQTSTPYSHAPARTISF
ncbi:MAG: zf-HC2 domain-containing protein [Candidatus Latescibacterota bacterium]